MPMLKGLSEKYHEVCLENEDLKRDLAWFESQMNKYKEICEKQVVLIDRLHIEIEQQKKNLQDAVYDAMGVIK